MKNFLTFCILIFAVMTANAQSGFRIQTQVVNTVDDKLQVLSANYDNVFFQFDLNKRVLKYHSDIFGDFEEQILNYNTGILITPVILDEKDYSFELANAIHEVWTHGAYWQLYASTGAPSQVYVVVEHPYIGEVNKRVYFKLKE